MKSIRRRLDQLEHDQKLVHGIPVLFVSHDLEHGANNHISVIDYEAGRLPRGVDSRTVVIIDNIGGAVVEHNDTQEPA